MSDKQLKDKDIRYVSRSLPSRNEAHGIKSRHSHRKRKDSVGEAKREEIQASDVKSNDVEQKEASSSDLKKVEGQNKSLKKEKVRLTTQQSQSEKNPSKGEQTIKIEEVKKVQKLSASKASSKKKKTKDNMTKVILKEVFSWALTIILAIGIYFAITNFVAQKYQVKGSSMYPTLQDKETVIGNKLEKIDRLDIVVFKAPDTGREYVKRVIGMPGDTITYLDGKLFVNDQQIDEPFINKEETIEINGQQTLGTGSFTLPQLTGEMVVPDDQYFVMGDNRGHSNDSRHFGFVKREAIHAVIRLIVWPVDKWHFFQTIPSP